MFVILNAPLLVIERDFNANFVVCGRALVKTFEAIEEPASEPYAPSGLKRLIGAPNPTNDGPTKCQPPSKP